MLVVIVALPQGHERGAIKGTFNTTVRLPFTEGDRSMVVVTYSFCWCKVLICGGLTFVLTFAWSHTAQGGTSLQGIRYI